jgi:hypothetical protein
MDADEESTLTELEGKKSYEEARHRVQKRIAYN